MLQAHSVVTRSDRAGLLGGVVLDPVAARVVEAARVCHDHPGGDAQRREGNELVGRRRLLPDGPAHQLDDREGEQKDAGVDTDQQAAQARVTARPDL